MGMNKPIRGFLFACTNKSEAECLNKYLFATDKMYGPIVIRIRKNDILFLNNIETDMLFGAFRAVSDGRLNIVKGAFNGKYPYQVKVKPLGKMACIDKATKLLRKYEIKRNTPILGTKLVDLLNELASSPEQLRLTKEIDKNTRNKSFLDYLEKIKDDKSGIDIEKEIPLIESTTLWDFPRQSYGITPKGDNKYAAVTPALIIYNMVWRYTEPDDIVLDPMCGSGTTIDVCKAEKRKVIGYDITSSRSDVIQNDARKLPLKDNSIDMVFIDSPYGDNIKYDDNPDNIGNISSELEEFYHELETVMIECSRVLRRGKVLGWLIGDQWVRGKYTPVGLKIYERLCKYFEPLEIVCVSRRGQSSNTGMWHNRARRLNFFLRGFKYLIIVKKPDRLTRNKKVNWAYYDRNNKGKL